MARPTEILPPLPVQASARAHDVRHKPLPPQAQGTPQRPEPAAAPETEAPEESLSSQQSLNVAILESEVSVRAADDPLALVYKAAIASINEELAPALGPNALQSVADEGLDTSPEATADRIVQGSTLLFARYQAANPDLKGQALVDQFISVIRGGIEQGFGEARDILEGLQVLDEEIAADIDRTFALVEEGLETFRQQQLDALDTPTQDNSDPQAASEPAETGTADLESGADTDNPPLV